MSDRNLLKLHERGRQLARLCAVAGLAAGLAGCASTQPTTGGLDTVNDPLEPFNRVVFAANNAIDEVVIRPVAYGYREVVPEVFRDRIRDFLRNLRSPIIIANELLQGDWEGAGNAAGRFFINSTVGIGGLIDFAGTYADMPYEPEDFGQTLASWGVGEGPYLVLPLLGPSNARDAVGFVADTLADPVRILATNTDADWANYVRYGATVIDERSRSIDATDELERSSVDYYAAVRSLYRQMREAAIADAPASSGGSIDIPDFDDSDSPGDVSALPAPGLTSAAGVPQIGELPALPGPLDLILPPVSQ